MGRSGWDDMDAWLLGYFDTSLDIPDCSHSLIVMLINTWKYCVCILEVIIKILIIILPLGIAVFTLLCLTEQIFRGNNMDTYMKKIWTVISGRTVIFNVLFVSI